MRKQSVCEEKQRRRTQHQQVQPSSPQEHPAQVEKQDAPPQVRPVPCASHKDILSKVRKCFCAVGLVHALLKLITFSLTLLLWRWLGVRCIGEGYAVEVWLDGFLFLVLEPVRVASQRMQFVGNMSAGASSTLSCILDYVLARSIPLYLALVAVSARFVFPSDVDPVVVALHSGGAVLELIAACYSLDHALHLRHGHSMYPHFLANLVRSSVPVAVLLLLQPSSHGHHVLLAVSTLLYGLTLLGMEMMCAAPLHSGAGGGRSVLLAALLRAYRSLPVVLRSGQPVQHRVPRPPHLNVSGVFYWDAISRSILTEGEKVVLVTSVGYYFTDVREQHRELGTYRLLHHVTGTVCRLLYRPMEDVAASMWGSVLHSSSVVVHDETMDAAQARDPSTPTRKKKVREAGEVECIHEDGMVLTRDHTVQSQRSDSWLLAIQTLRVLVKLCVHVGLASVVFGIPYSPVLVNALVASRRADSTPARGSAPWDESMYRTHMVYTLMANCCSVPFLGVNGLLEAFYRASANKASLRRFPRYVLGSGIVYLLLCSVGAGYGATGIVLASAVSMGLRIALVMYTHVRHVLHRWLPELRPRGLLLCVSPSVLLSSSFFFFVNVSFLKAVAGMGAPSPPWLLLLVGACTGVLYLYFVIYPSLQHDLRYVFGYPQSPSHLSREIRTIESSRKGKRKQQKAAVKSKEKQGR